MNAQLRPMSPEDLAVADLLCYAAVQWPGMKLGRHHRLVADKLMAVERGEIKRLIIEAPPRHTKTLLKTNLAAWWLGRNPQDSIIDTTYSQDRADDNGRAVRALVGSDEHRLVFGQTLMDESKAAKRFNVRQAEDGFYFPTGMDPKAPPGGYFAVGRGGPLTGRGGNLILIDDPIKDRQEADSQAVLRHLQDWYSSVLYTRLMPGGAIVLIMTRWVTNDLAGWLMDEYKHDGWELLSLPALAEKRDPLGRKPGEALWPEQYDEKALKRIKGAILPRDWDALYQQRPVKESGTFFKREWFEDHLYEPADLKGHNCHAYGASDFAVTDGEGDYTEHGLGLISEDFHLYLTDWWTGQETMDVWVEALVKLAATGKPLKWLGEQGVIRRACEPSLKRCMAENRTFFPMEWINRSGDKKAMARAIQGFASQGRVHFPRTQWARRVIDQCCAFTGSPNDVDDCVDVLALFGLAIGTMLAGQKSRFDKPDIKPFTREWLEYDENEHKKPVRRF